MEQSCLGTGDVVHHVFSLVCSMPDCHHTAVVMVGRNLDPLSISINRKQILKQGRGAWPLPWLPTLLLVYQPQSGSTVPSAQLAGWPSSGILKAAKISQRVLIQVFIQVLFTSKTKSKHFNDA